MTDRTTINVQKERHSNASEVKDDYDETWGDVLRFYAWYREAFPTYATDEPVSVRTNGESEESMQGVDMSEIDDTLKTMAQRLERIGYDVDKLAEGNLTVELDAAEREQIARDVAEELR